MGTLLSNLNKKKLDSIVIEMQNKSEPKSNIQAVVDDFKSKYGSSFGDFLKSEVMGSTQRGEGDSMGRSFIQTTIGSRGIAGVAQMPGRVIGNYLLSHDMKELDESTIRLADVTNKMTEKLKTIKDPDKKEQWTKMIKENLSQMRESGVMAELMGDRAIDLPEIASTSINAGLMALMKGPKGMGSGKATQALVARQTTKLGPKGATRVLKTIGKGRGALPRALEQGALGSAFVGSENIYHSRPLKENMAFGFAFGAVIPISGTTISTLARKLTSGRPEVAGRVVNSLIKPLKKDFAYGKNPGRAVAKEGIIAKTLDDLEIKVRAAKQKAGKKIGEELDAIKETSSIETAFQPIDDAIKMAEKSPRTNSGLIKRLQDTKDDLLMAVEDSSGKKVFTRKLKDLQARAIFEIKRDVGELTKFTGNISDDNVINKALRKTYGRLKGEIEALNPKIKPLSEHYGDLLSAEIATKYRAVIEQRQNLLKFAPKIVSMGGFVAGLATGNMPAIILSAGGAALEQLLSTPRAKTILAKWLMGTSKVERQSIYKQLPVLKNLLNKIFGTDVEAKISGQVSKKGSLVALKPKLLKPTKTIKGYHVVREKGALEKIKKEGFDLKKFGESSGTKDMGDPKGVYFFPDKASTQYWKDMMSDTGEFHGMIQSKLKIKNPLEIKSPKDVDKYFAMVKEVTKTKAKNLIEFQDIAKPTDSAKITKYLESKGYDSIIDKKALLAVSEMEPQIIVFNPKNIGSAQIDKILGIGLLMGVGATAYGAPKATIEEKKAVVKVAVPKKVPKEVPKKELKTFKATYYNPTDPNQTKKSGDGIGAFNRKVVFGDVAMGRRVYPKGTLIYIEELKDIKTPHGMGVFRVNDKKNKRYNTNQDNFDIAIPSGIANKKELEQRIGNNRMSFRVVK
jgi:hypothetical protein